MKVSGQIHAPAALSPGKEPPVPVGYEAGWAQDLVWTLWSREKSLAKSIISFLVKQIIKEWTHLFPILYYV
jgi:hypothetical protein